MQQSVFYVNKIQFKRRRLRKDKKTSCLQIDDTYIWNTYDPLSHLAHSVSACQDKNVIGLLMSVNKKKKKLEKRLQLCLCLRWRHWPWIEPFNISLLIFSLISSLIRVTVLCFYRRGHSWRHETVKKVWVNQGPAEQRLLEQNKNSHGPCTL